MKANDIGNMSDALYFLEQHGISKADAVTVLLKIFDWGLAAADVRRADAIRIELEESGLSHLISQFGGAA